jgi:NADPH-dependent curcumin reductase CurA
MRYGVATPRGAQENVTVNEGAINRQFRLASRPAGMLAREHFQFVTQPVPEAGPDQVLVRVMYLSMDPAMRDWVNERRSYMTPVPIGGVMRALGVGRVIASRVAGIEPGAFVTGATGVQDYAVLSARDVTRVDPTVAPLPRFIGALGITGITAYFGLLDIGQPKAGETVVVSGAAGAVGEVAAQIAKIKGCRSVGIAGGEAKCRYLVEHIGLDAAVDYKRDDLRKQLKQQCPDGIDVFFDNVGGDVLEAALSVLARKARVVLSGAISQYNRGRDAVGPRNYLALLVQRARMEGFVVFDYASRYSEAVQQLAAWIADGRLRVREDIAEGFDTFPETLQRLFRGENNGKLVLRVTDDG